MARPGQARQGTRAQSARGDNMAQSICPVCGKEFPPKMNFAKGKPTETCSPKCAAIRREIRKGKR